MKKQKEKILEVKDLNVSFRTDSGIVKAVRGVSFDLFKGETLCIVGESGSGKSVTSKSIMGILANNSIVESGQIIYEGEDLLKVSEEEFHRIRGNKIGMIFQDPLSSLNPIMKIGKQITETMLINNDKLKRRYSDLIAPQNTALKNAKVIRNQTIITAKNKNKDDIYQMNKELSKMSKAKDNLDNVEAYKKEIKEKRAEQIKQLKEVVKQAKAVYNANVPALKKTLKERKKTAKGEVNEYKKTIVAKRKEDIEKLKAKKQGVTDKQTIEKIDKEINDVKLEFQQNTKITRAEAKRRALEVMTEVGIPQPEKRYKQYPFQFSGGMRQRIVIAIALTAAPDILICDEPTTALDVTIQAQILELINDLKRERGLSCIFITHDLGVVANMADRVAVMYAGKIVEYGDDIQIFFNPQHPYTWALLASIPDIDTKEKLEAIPGTPPNLIFPPAGDAFAARSRYAMKIDFKFQPPYFKVEEGHYAATWLLHPDAPKVDKPKIVQSRIEVALKEEAKYEQSKEQ